MQGATIGEEAGKLHRIGPDRNGDFGAVENVTPKSAVGVDVEIRAVESCKKDLPEEDQKRLISLVGYKRTIVQIDRFGFVWLSFSEIETGADFCLFPSEVCVV